MAKKAQTVEKENTKRWPGTPNGSKNKKIRLSKQRARDIEQDREDYLKFMMGVLNKHIFEASCAVKAMNEALQLKN